MHKLDSLVPPPVALLIALVIMFFIARFDDARILRMDRFVVNAVIATGLVIAGITLGVLAIKQLKREFTTLNPFRPNTTSSLVTSGIFKFTRNPMYLGMVLVALGAATLYGSAWCLIIFVALIAFIRRFQIDPEERAMQSLFGKKFEEYKANTRRWI